MGAVCFQSIGKSPQCARLGLLAATAILASGCAFPRQVQRMTVEYNQVAAGMADELALLNIVRAKEDLPLHYTSFSRFSGTLTVKGVAGFNAALRGEGQTVTQTITNTNQTTTQQAPAGTTNTAQATLANAVASQIVEGVDAYTPSIGGEVASGPSFDIFVFDNQKFYQGILAAIPFSTVENYISQGFPNDLLLRVFVERITFKFDEGSDKGKPAVVWINSAAGEDAKTFADNVACYTLTGKSVTKDPVVLAPISRLVRKSDDDADFTIEEMALIDGKTLDLSGSITDDPKDDAGINLRRLSAESRVGDLKIKPACRRALTLQQASSTVTDEFNPGVLPKMPPPNPIYLGDFRAMTLAADGRSEAYVKVKPEIVFRSTEGVIRFLGQYLRAAEEDPANTYRVGPHPLFSVAKGRRSDDLVSTELLDQRYGIADDENRRRNMLIIALVEQLVNLHKESSDRPVTRPVQIVP